MTRRIILIANLILLCVNVPAFASDEKGADKGERQEYQKIYREIHGPTLRGLKGVWILVELLNPEIKEHGLTEDQIRTDTEVKLQTAGIRVIPTLEEGLEEPGKPYLYIKVETTHAPKLGVFSISLHVALKQEVQLTRNHAVIVSAATWEAVGSGIVREQDVQRIRDYVKDYVDQFINAYLTENPKQ